MKATPWLDLALNFRLKLRLQNLPVTGAYMRSRATRGWSWLEEGPNEIKGLRCLWLSSGSFSYSDRQAGQARALAITLGKKS
jgi:hypothetical protein